MNADDLKNGFREFEDLFDKELVGSRNGAMRRRSDLSVALRFL
jgi:hypothetical protein